MVQERNFYIRFIDADDYVFMDTVYNNGTNDYEIKFTQGEADGYTIKWEDYGKLTLSDGRTRAVWRTTMEDVVRVHVHFEGYGPSDDITQGQLNEFMNVTRGAAWGCLNVPPGFTQAQKREMYKLTKMLMIRLVMLLRQLHAE